MVHEDTTSRDKTYICNFLKHLQMDKSEFETFWYSKLEWDRESHAETKMYKTFTNFKISNILLRDQWQEFWENWQIESKMRLYDNQNRNETRSLGGLGGMD